MLQENFNAIDEINQSAMQCFLQRPVNASDKGRMRFNYIHKGEDKIQVYHLLYDNILLGCVCYGHVPQKTNVIHKEVSNVENIDSGFIKGQTFKVHFYCIASLN